MRTVTLALLGLLWAGVAEAATYYVATTGSDSNTCIQAQNINTPKRNIGGYGITTATGITCLTTPGDTLIVRDGTYVEAGIDIRVSGTAANPITIRAEHHLQAILSSISGNRCAPNIGIHASYVVIDGLRGQINPADPYCTPDSQTGAFARLWWSGNAPKLTGQQTTIYTGSVIRNCQIDAHRNRSVGIKTNQDNSIIENNVVHSSIEGQNANNIIFRNNYADTGDVWGDIVTCKSGARNCQIYNNTVHKTKEWMALVAGGNSGNIWDWDSSTGYECYNCVIYNNVVYVHAGLGAQAVGLIGCLNCKFFNNVIINGSLLLEAGGNQGIPPSPFPHNPVVVNNIFGCGGKPAHHYSVNTFTGTFTEDYNNFFNCTGTPSQAHPIIGDPRFVNVASDWHLLAGSPALSSGTAVSAVGYAGGNIPVNLAVDGTARVTPWDLGIYAQNGSSSGSSDVMPPTPPQNLTVR